MSDLQQIRRNTTEFTTVAALLNEYAGSSHRKKLVRLYALKPYQPIADRVLINSLRKNSAVLYNLSYESIIQYLEDRTHKLFRENDRPLYYFKTSASSDWIKFPFEFTGSLRQKTFPLRRVR